MTIASALACFFVGFLLAWGAALYLTYRHIQFTRRNY